MMQLEQHHVVQTAGWLLSWSVHFLTSRLVGGFEVRLHT